AGARAHQGGRARGDLRHALQGLAGQAPEGGFARAEGGLREVQAPRRPLRRTSDPSAADGPGHLRYARKLPEGNRQQAPTADESVRVQRSAARWAILSKAALRFFWPSNHCTVASSYSTGPAGSDSSILRTNRRLFRFLASKSSFATSKLVFACVEYIR